MFIRCFFFTFLILLFPILMHSADECSLEKLRKLQQLTLGQKVGLVVDGWAQENIHIF